MSRLISLLPQRSVLGALEQAGRPGQLTSAQRQVIARQFALSAAGGIAGYLVGRKYAHPVLGVLGGLSAGAGTALLVSGLPVEAARVALVETAAIGLALRYPRHPALAYVGGHVGAGLLTDALLPQTMRTEIGSDENGAPADGR